MIFRTVRARVVRRCTTHYRRRESEHRTPNEVFLVRVPAKRSDGSRSHTHGNEGANVPVAVRCVANELVGGGERGEPTTHEP